MYMIPGGGLEVNESEIDCAKREVSEETGFVTNISPCLLEIDEYYESSKYLNKYYLGSIIGQTSRHLTKREIENGAEPVWVDIELAKSIFSTHEKFRNNDEIKRGLYLREYTALCEIIK